MLRAFVTSICLLKPLQGFVHGIETTEILRREYVKITIYLPEKAERCLHIIVSEMFRIPYLVFMQPFIFHAMHLIVFISKINVCLSVTKYKCLGLKVDICNGLNTSHMSLISHSSLQPPNN